VPGKTENIRIRSVIGRFLEHSRIFYFAHGSERVLEGDFLIGSADWMYRNLSKRIEVVTPIFVESLKQKLWEILDISLRDQRQAWEMSTDGSYRQLHAAGGATGPEALGTHQTLMDMTKARLEG
jgi:polyphosphate kinase